MIGTHYVMLLLAAMTQHHEIKFPSMPGMPGSVMCTWSFQLHHMLSMTSARCAFMSDDKPTIRLCTQSASERNVHASGAMTQPRCASWESR